ncbi:ribosome silencing factor [Wohlfahrtiimonas sp. G9077]|uniref:ribosome silencing factor n=1 Tax=Wohlfahrtiimonas sp. G9077 TaxID=1980118 RepID=UPI000B97F7D8|nr:ribosome silencing factor [Wohlfahrtiimonas sp. G9077]OYQ73461.1 ribosome silencing factor [Wohlfahrtiimonas sp. G9077]
MSEAMKNIVETTLDDMKGVDIKVFDVSEIVKYTDWAVIVTGTSSTHLKAMADKLEINMKGQGYTVIGIEGVESGNWVLQDYGDIVVHIMTKDAREFYQLEKLFI